MYYYVLKSHMKARGVTQKELAEHLGITKQSLSSKMNMHSKFTIDECIAIKEYLKYQDSVDHLFAKINGA